MAGPGKRPKVDRSKFANPRIRQELSRKRRYRFISEIFLHFYFFS